jgi:hypothetical protein
MGKVARTVRDKMIPDKLIWVQFADAEIRAGEPCPRCGSRKILNLHADVARCPQCRAQLLLSNQGLEALDDGEGEGEGEDEATPDELQRAKMAKRIRELETFRLQRSGEAGHNELYTGWGEREAVRYIVLAEFEPSEEDVSLETMDERLLLVKLIPAHLLEGLVDVNELAVRPDVDWDLVYSAPPISSTS